MTLIDWIEHWGIYCALLLATSVMAFNLGLLIGAVWVVLL